MNLALEVLGKRPDGYHEIATVMHAVDLADRIVLEDADSVGLTTTARELPAGPENLCVRAARLVQEGAGVHRGVRIALDKRIPVAAGLGGGSSDAAATLLGLNRLWRVRMGRERLHALAVKLGMDVPFFLGNGRAVGTGRGEQLRRLSPGGGFALVLVNPRFALPTAEVYGRVGPSAFTDGARTVAMVEALRRRSATAVAQALYNGLEAVVEGAYPVIRRMKAALLGAGALGAAMSGSGPTVFGVARSLDHARQVRDRVARASWACWSVRTVSGAAVRIESVRGGGWRWGVAKR